MKFLELRDIQLKEIGLLNEVVDFLDKNKINYSLFAGTLLGAARHKGFIPWDDDIDLAMTKPEYEKLLNLLQDKKGVVNENVIALHPVLGNSQWPYLKFIDKRINVVEDAGGDRHLWIDIFPIVGFEKDNINYLKKIHFRRNLLLVKRICSGQTKITSKSISKKILIIMCKIPFAFISYEKMLNKYIRFCDNEDYNSAHTFRNNVWSNNFNELIYKEELDYINLKFEDREYKVFSGYKNILKRQYGNDYMELPPEEKRVMHCFKAWMNDEK